MKKWVVILLTALVLFSCAGNKDMAQEQQNKQVENFKGPAYIPEGPAGTEPPKPAMVQNEASIDDITTTKNISDERDGISGKDFSKRGLDTDKKEEGKKDSLSFVFIASTNQTDGKLLEYSVSLYYTTEDFEKSREILLAIVGDNGYIRASTASVSETYSSMNTEFSVKIAQMMATIRELNKLGNLLSENITLVDHTEDFVWAKRMQKRENIRISRRALAYGAVAAYNDNFTAREEALEKSENAQDAAEHSEWKIMDAVAWAKFRVTLEGPKIPEKIVVPDYRDALTGLVNFSLDALYGIIQYSPLIALIILIWIFRKKIAGIFKKKKEGGN